MKRAILGTVLGCLALASAARAQTVSYTVDPYFADPTPWLGYMNVFELPANGGAFVFGSPWGTADLTAVFNGPTLTLGPNTIGDPNPFWYTPSGGPGAQGNKIMDANMYVEFPAGTNNGVNITFAGVVTSNTLDPAYRAVAFIKDFDASYSSFLFTEVPLTPGPFSITVDTIPDPTRHVQFGFTINGPNVWVTDVAPLGNVQVKAIPVTPGDFDYSGQVNGADLARWKSAMNAGNGAADADGDGDSDGHDFVIWQKNLQAPVVGAAGGVPEPAAAALAACGWFAAFAVRRRRSA